MKPVDSADDEDAMANIQRGSGDISREAWKKVLSNLGEVITEIKSNGLKVRNIHFGRGLIDRFHDDEAFVKKYVKDELESPKTSLSASLDSSAFFTF